jgi:hypothetical protein
MRKSNYKIAKKEKSSSILIEKKSPELVRQSNSDEFILNDIIRKKIRLAAVRRYTTNPFSLNLQDAEDLLNEDYYEQ